MTTSHRDTTNTVKVLVGVYSQLHILSTVYIWRLLRSHSYLPRIHPNSEVLCCAGPI